MCLCGYDAVSTCSSACACAPLCLCLCLLTKPHLWRAADPCVPLPVQIWKSIGGTGWCLKEEAQEKLQQNAKEKAGTGLPDSSHDTVEETFRSCESQRQVAIAHADCMSCVRDLLRAEWCVPFPLVLRCLVVQSCCSACGTSADC